MTQQIELDSRTGATAQEFNPFSMLVSPESIISRVERSQQLEGLRKRVLRPLDRPWIMQTAGKMNSPTTKPLLRL